MDDTEEEIDLRTGPRKVKVKKRSVEEMVIKGSRKIELDILLNDGKFITVL